MADNKDIFSVDDILNEINFSKQKLNDNEPKKSVDIDSLIDEIVNGNNGDVNRQLITENDKDKNIEIKPPKKTNKAIEYFRKYELEKTKKINFKSNEIQDNNIELKKNYEIEPEQREQLDSFNINRSKKIKDFVLVANDDETENYDKSVSKDNKKLQEIDDYNSPEDAPIINLDLKELKTSLSVRFLILLIIAFAGLGIIAVNTVDFVTVPDVFNKSVEPFIFSTINFLLLILATAFSYTTMIGGLLSLVRFKPERDALPATAVIVCLIQNIIIMFNPKALLDSNIHLYSVIAIFILLFNTVGKLLIVTRSQLNFKLVSSDYKKYGVMILDNENEAAEYTRGLISDFPNLAYNKKTGFLSDFMYYSYGEDASDKISKFLVPISIGAALILFIAMQFVTSNFYIAATAFTATICICSPFTHLIIVNSPLKRAAKKLYKSGCAVLSYKSAEDFADVNSTIINAKDLFPEGSITLFGIKTFSGMRIDEAILDAASVACKANSILSDIFMKVIAQKTNLLKNVDNIIYEDTMGLSAWVDNKRVLIGTRDLMLNHGVDVPSKDYEDRYISQGNDLVYLSTAGELTAVFVVGLKETKQVKDALKQLEQNDIFVIVNSVDAVLTRDKLASIFDVPQIMFKILPARLQNKYFDTIKEVDNISSSVANNGTFYSYIAGMTTAKRLKSIMMIGNIVQAASIVVGYGLLAIFTYLRDFSQLTTLLVILYQLSWLVVTLITMRFKQI